MSAGNWIALAGVILTAIGLIGGSGVIVWKGSAKLTEISVVLQQLGQQLEALGTQMAATAARVADHESRLKGGGL